MRASKMCFPRTIPVARLLPLYRSEGKGKEKRRVTLAKLGAESFLQKSTLEGARVETFDTDKFGIGALAHNLAIRPRARKSARVSNRLGRLSPGFRDRNFFALATVVAQRRCICGFHDDGPGPYNTA